MTKTTLRICIVFFIFIPICSCATSKSGPIATGNPETMVNQLKSDLDAARSNQYDLLAPDGFDKAQSLYFKAKTALENGAKMSDIAEYTADANLSLKKAGEIAGISRTMLAAATAAREKALKVDADALGEPFLDVEHQYLNLSRAIESDNISYAQNNVTRVQSAYRDIEIMAIKHNALKDVRAMMAEAKRIKAHKRVPTAYESAEQALSEADAFIGANPYADDAIRQKAAAAAFEARRMLSVNTSRSLFDEMEPEASALYLEGLLARLSHPLAAQDLRDQSVDDQITSLIAAANRLTRTQAALQSENQSYQAQITDLEKRLEGMKNLSRLQEEAKKKLTAEREFNELFNKVQRSFRPNEAEVYKKGNQMVIRMRGINFPVGQAILSPENYTLLGKVQQAIRDFGQPVVTIEGHTDGTGSEQTNKVLSQMRADAVKTYLVANNTLPQDLIRAIGYGPSRPLASDTTPEGRAANRRIDVVITPSPVLR